VSVVYVQIHKVLRQTDKRSYVSSSPSSLLSCVKVEVKVKYAHGRRERLMRSLHSQNINIMVHKEIKGVEGESSHIHLDWEGELGLS